MMLSPENQLDPYQVFVAAVQATRRRAEGAGLAIGGALGVAADPYPHQVATAHRILTDVRVRHLIADEVGLGKTVQALMVLNALRWQNPSHKSVILVPDRLVGQWRDECWSRGHCKASVFSDEGEDDQEAWVRLVRPQSVQSGAFELTPDRFDLLVVDEPQLLPLEVMRVVERVASEFRQVLLLSATPGLGDPARKSRILKILEPERSQLAEAAGQPLLDFLEGLEALEADKLADPERTGEAAFRCFSTERRIARATRAEWGRYLPGRRYERVRVDPLFGERERVTLGMRWLDRARGQQSRTDPWRAAQLLHRSNSSARAMVRVRPEDASDDLALAVSSLEETPGDSRLDALADILASLWREAPEEQVIVVAGDNPTIDFLKPRLARYFGDEDEPLRISELRRSSESLTSEAADVEAMDEQLAPFSRGDSRLLLIGEWVQAGLNLHYFAKNIVFYCTPWDCETVDQLIGRLDRLRPNGLWRGDKGEHFGKIRVWSITQKWTVEEQVVSGLEALRLFERPLPPVSIQDNATIRSALESLAFGGGKNGMRELGNLATEWDDSGLGSRLSGLTPFTARRAQAQYDRLQASDPPEPVLRSRRHSDTFTSASEKALRGWIDFIRKSGMFAIDGRRDRANDNLHFNTFWYTSKHSKFHPFQVAEVGGAGWMDGHVPFILSRRDLGRPPRNTVVTDTGESGGRPLRFLDHGDALHESLIDGFINKATELCDPRHLRAVPVAFDPGHPILHHFSGQHLALASGYADAGTLGLPPFPRDELQLQSQLAPTEAQRFSLNQDIELAYEWWLSDQRWLRSQLPAGCYGSALNLVTGSWKTLPEDLKWLPFVPIPEEPDARCARQKGADVKLHPDTIRVGIKLAVDSLTTQMRSRWSAATSSSNASLRQRRSDLMIEQKDFLAARRSSVDRIESESGTAQEWSRVGRQAAAARRLEMAHAIIESRNKWLDAIPERITQAKPVVTGALVVRPGPLPIV